LEICPVTLRPGETPVTALYRDLLAMTDNPPETPAEAQERERWRDALNALD
jgi:hypothetical protein